MQDMVLLRQVGVWLLYAWVGFASRLILTLGVRASELVAAAPPQGTFALDRSSILFFRLVFRVWPLC